MGRFAIGVRAFGNSSGLDVKVLRETPGPHRMMAWKPVGGTGTECGMMALRQWVRADMYTSSIGTESTRLDQGQRSSMVGGQVANGTHNIAQ